ncbi:MAG: DMT family transporter [Nitrospirae bacterium]|nr:DMT family transporter [Candidatus Manganitrophaceae bacterium]
MTARGKAEWLLFATTFIWGGTFVIIKAGLADISPLLMIALRFTLATLVLLPFCLRAALKTDRKTFLWGFILGFLVFLGFLLQTAGLAETTASNSAFITTLMVVFTPLFQFLILKRRPRGASLIGVLIVCVGLWLLTAPAGGALNRGDLFTFFCALDFGLFIVLLDWTTRRHDPLLLTFFQILGPALYGWATLFLLEVPRFRPTPAVWIALGYTAVLATVVTGYIQTRYQRDTTPTRAALLFSLEPLWAALLGFFYLGERMGGRGMVGGALILAGILFSERSEAILLRGEQLIQWIRKR